MMKEYNVKPLVNKAGCVRCGGCSALNEAYKAIWMKKSDYSEGDKKIIR